MGTSVAGVTLLDTAVPKGTSMFVDKQVLIDQAKENVFGEFAVELPFRVQVGNNAVLVTAGVAAEDITDEEGYEYSLKASILNSGGLVTMIREKIVDVAAVGTAINKLEALDAVIPVIDMSLNQLWVMAGEGDPARVGWGDFLRWDTVLDNILRDPDVSKSCPPGQKCSKACTIASDGTVDERCAVDIFGLVMALKEHALSLLKIPEALITAGTGADTRRRRKRQRRDGTESIYLKAAFAPSIPLSVRPSYTKLFDGLPLKFRAEGEIVATVKAKAGFKFTADFATSPTPSVSNALLVRTPMQVMLEIDVTVEIGVIFGIVEGTAKGSLSIRALYDPNAADTFSGYGGATLEIEASLDGQSLSDANAGNKPTVALSMPSLFDTKTFKVEFFNFENLYQMIQLTPENLLAMLRALDKFLADYTNTEVFQMRLPMLNVNLADVLNFASGFEKRISDKMKQPKPKAEREKEFLAVASGKIRLPFTGKEAVSFTIIIDDESIAFTPFKEASNRGPFNDAGALAASDSQIYLDLAPLCFEWW